MARIGILTCLNCTQELHCASVVCLGDMRKRRGFFSRYAESEPLDLIGIISCSGCPTLAGYEKILKRVRALAEYRIDALHLSFCMIALCPHMRQYKDAITHAYPRLEVISGTHVPREKKGFREQVGTLLCSRMGNHADMNDLIRGTTSQ